MELLHPRVLVYYLRVLREGGAILHDVPGRVVASGGEGGR